MLHVCLLPELSEQINYSKTVVMNVPNMAVQKWLWAAHDIQPVAVPLGLNGRKPGGQMNLHSVGE